ncbi:HAD family hydrolase [Nocardioides zeae]|uniref:HAD family hydrolase n=1 Tax=Nocardioides imazamoxiresistens TaxID=3231893 RepID=A0ABU3PVF7_9ACTN|nr:HAD family hydrolase [Nocardioides zeae]MDT9593229.1 HAD family hydrolase [Nocardioides zeae]
MTRPPRLVATDLDGTLLDAAGRVGERTRTVLAELDDRGVPVVFVTGRPVRWMHHLWQEVGGHGLAICSNGGIVYDVAAGAIRDTRALPGPALLELVERLRRELPGTVVAYETTDGFAREPRWTPRRADDGDLADVVVDDLEAFAASGPACVKVLARADDADPEAYWHRLEDLVGDLVTVTFSSTSALVEMSAVGVTKASTLELLCADLDVDASEVVAFGDMPNDIPLLSWAGHGVAMAGAHPAVRAVADDVAGDHDDDGVARALVALFGLAGWAADDEADHGGTR